jgi:hypothetical protein
MDSNPDEFIMDGWHIPNKWGWVMVNLCHRAYRLVNPKDTSAASVPGGIEVLPFLPDDEILTVYKKFTALQGQAFTEAVLNTLLNPDSKPEYDLMGNVK